LRVNSVNVRTILVQQEEFRSYRGKRRRIDRSSGKGKVSVKLSTKETSFWGGRKGGSPCEKKKSFSPAKVEPKKERDF